MRIIKYLMAFLFLLAQLPSLALSEPLIKEFIEPQDSYLYHRTSPVTATLTCRFEKTRFKVKGFSLYIPPDVKVQWRLLKGEGNDSQNSYQISEESIDGISNVLKVDRYWLGDIPIHSWSFPNVNHMSIRDRDPSTQNMIRKTGVVLTSATFELTFSRPFGFIHEPGTPTDPHQKDPFREIARLLVSNPEDIPAERQLPASMVYNLEDHTSSYPKTKAEKLDQTVIRIDTRNNEGVLTRIPFKRLKDYGVAALEDRVKNFSAYHLGKPYPIEIETFPNEPFENGNILIFHPPIESEETDRDAFFLIEGATPGLRLTSVESPTDFFGINVNSATPQAKLRSWDFAELALEENHPEFYYEKNTLAGPIEVMWKEFRMEGDSLTVDFDLEGFFIPEISNLPADASHPLRNLPLIVKLIPPEIYKGDSFLVGNLNQQALSEQKIPAGAADVKFDVPSGSLRERGNRLTLSFKGKLPILSDQYKGILLDWIRLPYPSKNRYPRSEEKPVSLYGLELTEDLMNQPVQLSTKTKRKWLLYSSGSKPEEIKMYRFSEDCQNLEVPSTIAKAHWWLIDPESAQEPARIEEVSSKASLRGDIQGSDMVVVTDQRFVSQLEEYLTRYEQQGISTKVVTTQQIYDDFSYGIKSLAAIRDYCHFLVTHAEHPRPHYLWLVGEARWDPTNQLGSKVEDLVPSPAVRSRGSIHSNDQWYAYLIGEDAFPDLLVARISVGTTEELKHYLDKVREDQDSFQPDWWRSVGLYLADDGFTEEIESGLRHGLEKVCVPEVIRQEAYPLDPFRKFEAAGRVGKEARGIRGDVVQKWSEGARMVEYAGHGGITVWSHEALFKGLNRPDSDVDRLTNKNRYSFVTIRSCMSASINWPSFPGEVSVSEALIKAPNRGAIAVLGSSGTEFANDQERFGSKVRSAIWNHHLKTLSEIRAYAHCQFLLQTPDLAGVVNQFMLHGDPLMRFDVPEPIENLDVSFIEGEHGPDLQLEIQSPILPATGQARVYSHRNVVHETSPFRIDSATQTLRIPVPPEVPFKQNIKVGIYLWNQAQRKDAFGARTLEEFGGPVAEPFALYRKWVPGATTSADLEVSDLIIQPTSPVVGEPVVIEATLANRGTSPIRLQHIELKYGESLDTSRYVERELIRGISYPFDFYPGDQRTFKWMQNPTEGPVHFFFTLRANQVGKTIEKTGSVEVRYPPEIEVLSIQPAEPEKAYPTSEPLVFRIDINNKGGILTEPLRLLGQNLLGDEFFQTSLPCLAPAEIYSTTFAVISSSSRFEWETRIDPMPTAYTSRTKWKRQSFKTEAHRAVKITLEREWQQTYDNRKSLAPFTLRYFNPENLTMQIDDEARYRDIPPMNLDLLETAQVHSATHAGVAAWQSQAGWWLSPFQIQAYPLWQGPQLKMRLPWNHEPAIALLAPKYYKQDNYQNLGFPMPWVTLTSGQGHFDLEPANTDVEGHFPERMVELKSPGIDWTLKNHLGAWPGFAGFRLGVLAEFGTPVFELPEDATWTAELIAEWYPKPPMEISQQFRSGVATDSLGAWTTLSPGTKIRGKALQIRSLIRPDESHHGALVRSLLMKISKVD